MRKKSLTVTVLFYSFTSFAQHPDSTLKNFIKLDFVPLYDVVFDSHFQLRIGVEFEKQVSKKSSAICYLDAGIFDKYDFIKYYDFFSQNQGLYSVNQKVSVSGFHLLPGYNYHFYAFKKKPNRKFFTSVLGDFSFYHKKISTVNTSTLEESGDKYNQFKFGMGLGVGFKNTFRKHFMYELKTSMLTKVYNYVSEEGRNPIRAMDAQWASPNYNFWWISNIKIGYVF